MRRVPAILAAALAWAVVVPPSAARAGDQAIALVVTDADGAFVPDLRREEVRVVENGELRPIERFERDERPLHVVLVLDTGQGASAYHVHAYEDVAAFVGTLPAKATCTLWTTADRPRRMGKLGNSPAAIERAVGRAFVVGGTSTLLDALVEAAGELGDSRGRRRALVVVSSRSAGHTTWEPPQIMKRVRAPRARVLVVEYQEGGRGGGGVAGMLRDASSFTLVTPADHERMLSTLSRATGGRFEPVETAAAVDGVLRSFARELAGQYRLVYSSVPAREGRKVDVRLARPGLRFRVTVDSP